MGGLLSPGPIKGVKRGAGSSRYGQSTEEGARDCNPSTHSYHSAGEGAWTMIPISRSSRLLAAPQVIQPQRLQRQISLDRQNPVKCLPILAARPPPV